MSDSQITIFYSWQSDLPGSETRNIIQDSIKDAVRLLRDTVDIEADRDTKGEFGSPDIAQTIFSKIDDCDIFVADVSAVCRYEATDKDGNKKVKYMPNPNVMLELGYATHVVGWDNVICVLNADYGAPEDMPFDIASRRLTPFSLKDGKSKGEIKRYIKGVIQDIVENILENGKRVKTGFSDLRLGCYDDGSISNMLHPIEVSNSVSFVKHKTQILDESLKLVEQIRSMKITEPSELLNTEEASNADEKQTSNATAIIRKDGSVLTPVTSSLKLNLFKLQRVHIKDEDRNTIIDLCKNYLGIDIYEDTDFFNIGNLERKYDLMSSYSYEGTKDEENKYDSIMMLEYNLHRVRMLDWYATTFDGLFFIPLSVGTQVWNIDKAISTEGKSFARALIILQEARRTGVLSSKIDKYCSVLECIYAIKKEHKKNISNITAAYIGKDSEEQERIRENMRDAYGVRSDGSHGDNLKYLQENNRENLVKLSTDIDDYVRRVFRKVIAVENLNYNNTSEEKARVRKYFSDLAKTVYPE